MNILPAAKDYYLGYGLERDPFPEADIDNIFFTTPELNQRIDLIKHLLQFGQQLLVVQAPAGAGKSTLCKYLQSTVDPAWSVHCIDAGPDLSPEGLAFAVIRELYPEEYARTVPALSRFYKYLEFCDRDGKLPVIMIDNGHRLKLDTLEFILQLNEKTHNATRFRFVIFADPQFSQLLEDPRIKVSTTGILHNLSIPLLTEDQTAAYLEHRLQSSGIPERQPFTGENVQQICRVSGGAPGQINRLARQAMQGPTARWKRAAPGLLRRLRNPVVAAVLIFLAFALYYFLSQRPAGEAPPRPEISATPSPAPASTAGRITPAPATEPEVEAAAGTATPLQPQAQPQELPAARAAVVPATAPVVVRQQPPPAAASPGALSPQFAGLKGDEWIRAQDPDSYVLQVLGAQEVTTLEKYLQAAPELRGQLIVITTRNAGKPWYVFLYGLYPSHDAAAAAITGLPAAARKSRPWPRTVASIRSDLEKIR